MPVKTSQRFYSFWNSWDELRGELDGSPYRDHVLVLLLVKYISDKAVSQKSYPLEIPKGSRFADVVALKGDTRIGDRINLIIARLAEANELKGIIDIADFNDSEKLGDGKEMVDRLSNLVVVLDNSALNFRNKTGERRDDRARLLRAFAAVNPWSQLGPLILADPAIRG